jgi:hypothetical protein
LFAGKRLEVRLYLCDRVPLQWFIETADTDSSALTVSSRFLRLAMAA